MCFQGWDFHCDFPEKYSRVFFYDKTHSLTPMLTNIKLFFEGFLPFKDVFRSKWSGEGQTGEQGFLRDSCGSQSRQSGVTAVTACMTAVTAVALRAGSREWVRRWEGRDTVALMQHTLLIQIFRLR